MKAPESRLEAIDGVTAAANPAFSAAESADMQQEGMGLANHADGRQRILCQARISCSKLWQQR